MNGAITQCELVIYGEAQPQGSKSPMLQGKRIAGIPGALLHPKVYMIEGRRQKRKDGSYTDGPQRAKAWREAVAEAGRIWRAEHAGPLFDGPLRLYARFFMPRPKSLPKRVTRPIKKPDLSKLARSVEDSLTNVVIEDDARIVDLFARKFFAVDDSPRAVLTISMLDPAQSDERDDLLLELGIA